MKSFFKILAISSVAIFASCSPEVSSPDQTTLIHTKTSKSDTNTYVYSLSCGCDFELQTGVADTVNIIYDLTNIGLKASSHTIKAFVRPGMPAGKYTGSLAIVTVKPDTQEDFRDTLRDTIMAP
jgi:hypothetical protein